MRITYDLDVSHRIAPRGLSRVNTNLPVHA